MGEVTKAAENLLAFALAQDSFPEATLSEEDLAPQSEGGALVGRVLGGRYQLVRRIGYGGVSEVYEARVRSGGPNVAVKIMRQQMTEVPEIVRRFRREARAAALLAHTNVVRVLELAEDPKAQLIFIVMELLQGQTLGSWLGEQTAPPELRDVVAILLPVIDAFEAAHAEGIIHRDLKPDNIFLERGAGEEVVVKVLDFGLARVPDPEDTGTTLTRPDSMGGTPDYMSPEQCQSLRVGPPADLYSFGCVLTEMLQLRAPFEGGCTAEVMARHMYLPPPRLDRPRDAEPVPEDLERLRLDLLAKDPAARPRSFADVRDRLVESLVPHLQPPALSQPPPASTPPPGGEPVSAQASMIARVRRFLRGWRPR